MDGQWARIGLGTVMLSGGYLQESTYLISIFKFHSINSVVYIARGVLIDYMGEPLETV